jgi:hypothetical protein
MENQLPNIYHKYEEKNNSKFRPDPELKSIEQVRQDERDQG